jgi:hypothetical protein
MKGVKKKAVGYDDLYRSMEKQLEELEAGRMKGRGYEQEIGVVLAAIGELRAVTPVNFEDEQKEREFFGAVWPRFYGKLFYYQSVHRFVVVRGVLPAESHSALIRHEERRVAAFFRRHREFWIYYRCGAEIVSRQFTREYSRSCLFDPLAAVLEPGGATLASWRAAWGLPYEEYRAFLRDA